MRTTIFLMVMAALMLRTLMGVMAQAQTDPKASKLAGTWQGALDVNGTKLRLVLELKLMDGKWSGILDSVDQGAKIPISAVKIEGETVHIEVSTIGGSFEGKLDADGKKLTGEWNQGGASLPLELIRGGKAPEPKRPQMPKKPYPYHEEEVTYKNKADDSTLAGTLTLPKGSGPFPVAVLITGSGQQDRDESLMGHKPFLVLADYLTRQGIAVLRVDDRGVGGSNGDLKTATSETFAGDVLAGVDYLKTRKEINPKQIGLIGHSEGGLIAPMVASRSKDIAFIVLMAGTGLTGEEILYLQGALISRAAGAPEEAVTLNTQIQKGMFTVLKAEPDNKKAEEKLHQYWAKKKTELPKGTDEQAKAINAQIEGQIKAIVSPWFRYFLTCDPRTFLKQVTCPVLAINGEKDLQVPPKENLAAIKAALEAGGNKDFTCVELPGLNHLFQTAKTGSPTEYSAIEETLSPDALKRMGDWVLAHTVKK